MPATGELDRPRVGLQTPSAGDAAFYKLATLYVQVVVLLVGTFVIGHAGIGAIRYAFIAGCAAIGYQAWRLGPARHIEFAIILFVWAPFLRRVVDLTAGFEPSGYMLVGPVLALMPVSSDVYAWLVTGRIRRATGMLGPYGVMALCMLYGLTLSVTNGDLMPAIIALTKYVPPMIYGVWLIARGAEEPNVIDGAARGLMIAMPLAGLYGIYQYFYLPDWDAYWITMTAAISNSQGLAEAEKVRVFGPMNSAASFGHFLLAALLLLGFARRGWHSLLLCPPVIVSLLLSSYRTAWLGLVVGVAYCWFNNSTRRRAGLIAVAFVGCAAIILATTSLGDVVGKRLSTFGTPSEDGSAQARSTEYSVLLDKADDLLFGTGMGSPPATARHPRATRVLTDAVDGVIVSFILMTGLVVGSVYIMALLWAGGQGLLAVTRTRDQRLVAAGAIVLANVLAMPLSSINQGEVGFLFLAFLGIISAKSPKPSTGATWSHRAPAPA